MVQITQNDFLNIESDMVQLVEEPMYSLLQYLSKLSKVAHVNYTIYLPEITVLKMFQVVKLVQKLMTQRMSFLGKNGTNVHCIYRV